MCSCTCFGKCRTSVIIKTKVTLHFYQHTLKYSKKREHQHPTHNRGSATDKIQEKRCKALKYTSGCTYTCELVFWKKCTCMLPVYTHLVHWSCSADTLNILCFIRRQIHTDGLGFLLSFDSFLTFAELFTVASCNVLSQPTI